MKQAVSRLALHLILLAVLVFNLNSNVSMVVRSIWSELVRVPAVHAQAEDRVEAEQMMPVQPDPATTASPEASVLPVDTVFIKPQQSEKIKALLKLYQDQVEKYSKSEREYRISKAQFEKLTTLQSLEEAIVKTRQAMLDRDDVLITYCELVRAHLQDGQGIEISMKAAADANLEKQILDLKAHREKVAGTTDRAAMLERAQEFATISEPLSERVYTALALISVGDLQAIYDKTRIVYNEIRTYHQENPTSALRQEERDRAYREVEIAQESVRAKLEELRIESASGNVGVNSYNSGMKTALSEVYAGNSKLLEYLRELLLELT